jgi:hypothetical protein
MNPLLPLPPFDVSGKICFKERLGAVGPGLVGLGERERVGKI